MVFDRFYRGRNSKASRQPGSGLGLAIAKWLVEKHKGAIALTSEVGSFTEVQIRIPYAEASLPQGIAEVNDNTAPKRTPRKKIKTH